MSPRINPITPRLRWEVLSSAELERIHEATLHILETVGIHFPSQRALDVLRANGCQVDDARQMVRLPRAVVTEAVAQAPGPPPVVHLRSHRSIVARTAVDFRRRQVRRPAEAAPGRTA